MKAGEYFTKVFLPIIMLMFLLSCTGKKPTSTPDAPAPTQLTAAQMKDLVPDDLKAKAGSEDGQVEIHTKTVSIFISDSETPAGALKLADGMTKIPGLPEFKDTIIIINGKEYKAKKDTDGGYLIYASGRFAIQAVYNKKNESKAIEILSKLKIY